MIFTKISRRQTKKHGITTFFPVDFFKLDGGDMKEIEKENRNNMIRYIRMATIDEHGNGRESYGFPHFHIIPNPKSIKTYVEMYQKSRKIFLMHKWKGLDIYDELMSNATKHIDKIGLNFLPWIGGKL